MFEEQAIRHMGQLGMAYAHRHCDEEILKGEEGETHSLMMANPTVAAGLTPNPWKKRAAI